MKITISGKGGAGKSTVGRMLAEELGYTFYSIGDLRGKMAMDRGITIDALNEIGKTEGWTDKEADKLTKEVGETEDNFVIDGWIAYHFIPDSVKIFLDVDASVGAERIFESQREDEEKQDTVDGVKEMVEKRMKENQERYMKWYDIDYLDTTNYELVIDTSELSPDETVKKILGFLKTFK